MRYIFINGKVEVDQEVRLSLRKRRHPLRPTILFVKKHRDDEEDEQASMQSNHRKEKTHEYSR